MPVYNTALHFLSDAIQSVLLQDFKNFSLYIIDDNSSNDISSVVSLYDDARIFYTKFSENHGASYCRNYAIENSTSELIAFIDSDDIWFPEKLSRQIKFMLAHPKVGCLGTKAKIIGNDAANFHLPNLNDETPFDFFMLFFGNCFITSSMLIKRDIIDKYSLKFDSNYELAEDYKFWLDFIGKTDISNLDNELVCYRFHKTNLSHVKKDKQREICLRAKSDKEIELIGMNIPDDEFRKLIVNPKKLTFNEIQNLVTFFRKCCQSFLDKGFSKEKISSFIFPKYKSLFIHSHGLKSQYFLFKTSISKFIYIPFFLKFYFLITRCI